MARLKTRPRQAQECRRGLAMPCEKAVTPDEKPHFVGALKRHGQHLDHVSE